MFCYVILHYLTAEDTINCVESILKQNEECKIIIVDNMPQNFRLQKENGINIKAFWGEDSSDNVLAELGIILVNIAIDGGDVRKGLEKYKDEIIRKVTSNIYKNKF